MSDHDLPQYAPEDDIRYVKRFWLYLVASDHGNWVTDLEFGIVGHTSEDQDESGGTRISSVGGAEALLDEFLRAPGPLSAAAAGGPTPLDFSIEKKCFVMLKLAGDFWEFSRRSAGAVRTKANLVRRYYRLRQHEIDGRIACVSFCAQQPEHISNGVKHSINFYVDFLQKRNGNLLKLPVIIDPDIENKGGG